MKTNKKTSENLQGDFSEIMKETNTILAKTREVIENSGIGLIGINDSTKKLGESMRLPTFEIFLNKMENRFSLIDPNPQYNYKTNDNKMYDINTLINPDLFVESIQPITYNIIYINDNSINNGFFNSKKNNIINNSNN